MSTHFLIYRKLILLSGGIVESIPMLRLLGKRYFPEVFFLKNKIHDLHTSTRDRILTLYTLYIPSTNHNQY